MPRGGLRPGAGRPRTRTEATPAPVKAGRTATAKAPKAIPATSDPEEFFRLVLADPTQSMTDRMRAALALHGKPAVGAPAKPEPKGKKEVAQERAEEIAAGSVYAPRQPPTKLRAV